MSQEIITSADFSPHLFWDINLSMINPEKNKKWLIARVLEYGFLKDWNLIVRIYGIKDIAQTATSILDISKKTASFLSCLTEISKEQFACYSTKQSPQNFWNS